MSGSGLPIVDWLVMATSRGIFCQQLIFSLAELPSQQQLRCLTLEVEATSSMGHLCAQLFANPDSIVA
jgi:hypothetical protein